MAGSIGDDCQDIGRCAGWRHQPHIEMMGAGVGTLEKYRNPRAQKDSRIHQPVWQRWSGSAATMESADTGMLAVRRRFLAFAAFGHSGGTEWNRAARWQSSYWSGGEQDRLQYERVGGGNSQPQAPKANSHCRIPLHGSIWACWQMRVKPSLHDRLPRYRADNARMRLYRACRFM
jgi:hypothetical protein